MHPPYWDQFIRDHRLVGRSIEIPKAADATGLGADLEIYTAEQSREEAEQFHPGIAVAPDGFVPVAQCLGGSGDRRGGQARSPGIRLLEMPLRPNPQQQPTRPEARG
jgi:hypothetical protein